MAKRYGRTLVSPRAAASWSFQARVTGSDHADLAGNCQRPVIRPLTGLQDARLHKLLAISEEIGGDPFCDWAPGLGLIDNHGRKASWQYADPARPVPIHADVAVRCRKCPNCLKARSAQWRIRAQHELRAAPRTWFGTLTLSPDSHFRIANLCRLRLAEQGLDFDALEPDDQFSERVREVNVELTKYIKRVRKQSKAKIRYILVVEAHKSGLPHWHCLIHEVKEPVRYRCLTEQWPLGFSNFKQVSGEASAGYVCKYLAKSALARVRASKDYGTAVAPIPEGSQGNKRQSLVPLVDRRLRAKQPA